MTSPLQKSGFSVEKMFLPKNRLIAPGISLLQTLFSFGELTRDIRRYPWYITRDIRTYPWYIPQDITAAISRVIYHEYLRISSCLCHGYNTLQRQLCW